MLHAFDHAIRIHVLDGYLMFVGRMSPDKGPDRAIQIARRAGQPLVLVAKMREPAERSYFEQRVQPLLGPDITYLGEADAATRMTLLRHADALVNPITWPEPFGLVMAEALASGTPVITTPSGAAPEIVDDGLTGFVCRDPGRMAAAAARVGEIDRRRCRAVAERRFSLQQMASSHAALYRQLLEGTGGLPAAPGSAVDQDIIDTGSAAVIPLDLIRRRARRGSRS